MKELSETYIMIEITDERAIIHNTTTLILLITRITNTEIHDISEIYNNRFRLLKIANVTNHLELTQF